MALGWPRWFAPLALPASALSLLLQRSTPLFLVLRVGHRPKPMAASLARRSPSGFCLLVFRSDSMSLIRNPLARHLTAAFALTCALSGGVWAQTANVKGGRRLGARHRAGPKGHWRVHEDHCA